MKRHILFIGLLFIIWCFYIEQAVGSVFFRPNEHGIYTLRFNNIIPMIFAPFRYFNFWYISMWDINIFTFILFFYSCIFFIPNLILSVIK